jgi:hypothetical protein
VETAFEPPALRDPVALEVRALGLDDEAESDEADSGASPEPEPAPEVSSDDAEPASPETAVPLAPVRPRPPRRRRRRFGAWATPEAPSPAVAAFGDGPASAGGALVEVVNGSSLTCGPSLLGPRSARWSGR